MKRVIMLLVLIFLFNPCPVQSRVGMMDSSSGSVPRVVYICPADESIVDLGGRNKVLFAWQRVPIPSGNREVYKFELFKGNGYDRIMSQTVDGRTFSIEVPADIFEDGAGYRWYVRQRDARTLNWSQHDDWYFNVIKR